MLVLYEMTCHLEEQPLQILMLQPSSLNTRLVKLAILLSEYNMKFISQNSAKWQAIADLMAYNLVPLSSMLYDGISTKLVRLTLCHMMGLTVNTLMVHLELENCYRSMDMIDPSTVLRAPLWLFLDRAMLYQLCLV